VDLSAWASQLVIGACVVAGAVSRWTLVDRIGGFRGFVRGLSAAILVSMILYFGLAELALAPGVRIAVIAACSFVAEDMLLAGRACFQALKDDPAGLLIRIVKAIFTKGAKE
jgi:ABC-type arginine transport system permease subunit